MSRAQILDMLRRQAAYDSHGAALVGGMDEEGGVLPGYEPMIAAGALVGGRKKKGSRAGRDSKGRFLPGHKATHGVCTPGYEYRAKGERAKRCHKFIRVGGGCGMCGACGGILKEEPVSEERKMELKALKKAAKQMAADWCPPYTELLDKKAGLTKDELTAYIKELGTKAVPSAVLKEWRKRKTEAERAKALSVVLTKAFEGKEV